MTEDVQIAQVQDEKTTNAVLDLFRAVCAERGWEAGDIFQALLPSSVTWAALRGERVVGGVQMVVGSPSDFPISKKELWSELNLEARPGFIPAEVAMLAVDREERGAHLLFIPLFAQLYIHSKQVGITHWYAILDKVIARLYRRLSLNFAQIGLEKLYWNEPCFPAVLSVALLEEDLQQNRPDLWALVG